MQNYTSQSVLKTSDAVHALWSIEDAPPAYTHSLTGLAYHHCVSPGWKRPPGRPRHVWATTVHDLTCAHSVGLCLPWWRRRLSADGHIKRDWSMALRTTLVNNGIVDHRLTFWARYLRPYLPHMRCVPWSTSPMFPLTRQALKSSRYCWSAKCWRICNIHQLTSRLITTTSRTAWQTKLTDIAYNVLYRRRTSHPILTYFISAFPSQEQVFVICATVTVTRHLFYFLYTPANKTWLIKLIEQT